MLYSFEKVLFIAPADKFGGIGSVLRNYSKFIDHFNIINTHDSEVGQKYVYFFRQLFKILRFLQTNRKIEIVHIHAASKGSFIRKSIVLFIGKAFSKKVIFHIHGGGFLSFYYSSLLIRQYIKFVLIHADAIVCLSLEWKEIFYEKNLNANIKQLNNPIIPSNYGYKRRDSDKLRLLFLGAITDAKGIFELLQYLSSNPFFKQGLIYLTIGGKGDSARLNEFLTNQKLASQVTYLGWVDDIKKEKAFLEHDVFILPSYYEGMPVSVLEAMAAKMPIIATDIGGIPSVVKPGLNGWLFKPGDFMQLNDVFNDIFGNNISLEAYGHESEQQVQPFLIQQVICDLSDIYFSI